MLLYVVGEKYLCWLDKIRRYRLVKCHSVLISGVGCLMIWLTAVRFNWSLAGYYLRPLRITFYFQAVQNDVNRHGTSVEALNEMFHTQKKKQKESKIKQLNKLWSDVLEKSDTRKEELKSVFIMIGKDFERWELGMIKRLDSGELVTSDILVFEERLQVSAVSLKNRKGKYVYDDIVARANHSFFTCLWAHAHAEVLVLFNLC